MQVKFYFCFAYNNQSKCQTLFVRHSFQSKEKDGNHKQWNKHTVSIDLRENYTNSASDWIRALRLFTIRTSVRYETEKKSFYCVKLKWTKLSLIEWHLFLRIKKRLATLLYHLECGYRYNVYHFRNIFFLVIQWILIHIFFMICQRIFVDLHHFLIVFLSKMYPCCFVNKTPSSLLFELDGLVESTLSSFRSTFIISLVQKAKYASGFLYPT